MYRNGETDLTYVMAQTQDTRGWERLLLCYLLVKLAHMTYITTVGSDQDVSKNWVSLT